jgi:hypothetical protein
MRLFLKKLIRLGRVGKNGGVYINGGKLELHAKFPDGQDIEIKQFNRA